MGFEFRDKKTWVESQGALSVSACVSGHQANASSLQFQASAQKNGHCYIHFLHISLWPSSCLHPVVMRSWSPKLQWL